MLQSGRKYILHIHLTKESYPDRDVRISKMEDITQQIYKKLRHFTKDSKMNNKHIKRCLLTVNLVNDRESANTIWSTSTYLPSGMAVTNKKTDKYWQLCENNWNLHILVVIIKTGIITPQKFPLGSKTKHIIFTTEHLHKRNAHRCIKKTCTLISAILF